MDQKYGFASSPTQSLDAKYGFAAPPKPVAPAQPAAAPIHPQAVKPASLDEKYGFSKPDTPQATAPVVRTPGGLLPNIQETVDTVARAQGLPVWALRGIARLESGGQPHPESSVSPAGAVGVMQLMPSTFAELSRGDIRDINTNVTAGAMYYKTLLQKYKDPVYAAGAYNAGPGAMDAYLAGKGTLPQETLNYMASFSHLQTPIDETPLPPHPTPTPSKPNAPAQKPVAWNTDPTKAEHAWYDQLFGHQDLPFILDNAALANKILPGEDHLAKALHLWVKNPAAAADLYGDNAKQMLMALAEMPAQSDPIMEARRQNARAMLAHPLLAAGETFLEEWFNPLSWVEGGIAGKGLGLGARLLNQTYMGRQALHAFSPYREIVARHGENARNLLHQMGQLANQGGSRAEKVITPIFKGLTQAEQWEVVRIHQGLTPNPQMQPNASLFDRAAKLHNAITDLSLRKVQEGVLKPSQLYDLNKYFPMRGTSEHPIYDEDTMSFLDQLRPNVKTQPPSAESLHQRKYRDVDESTAAGHFDPMKVNAASQLFKYIRSGEQNIEFERGLKRIMARYPDMIQQGNVVGNRLRGPAPKDRWGRDMINIGEVFGSNSPTLRSSWVSREFSDFLSRGKAPRVVTGVSDDDAIRNTLKVFGQLNAAQRNFIIANPLYHPFWNVNNNASAAGRANLPESMRGYVRAMLGTAFSVGDFAKMIPGGVGAAAGRGLNALEQRFWMGSQQYAADLADAIRAGATAEMHASSSALGGDAARLKTLAFDSLTGMEKLDRFITEAWDWNSKATFGERGEGQFVAWLYKRFTDPKRWNMAPEDAAWAVREALGHYNNVDPNPNGFEGWMLKMTMFYPWLKGNLPFWLKTILTNPVYVRAPETAMRRESQIAEDPRAESPQYPRAGTQMYLGRQGIEDVAYSAMFPYKDALKAGDVAFNPNVEQKITDVLDIVGSRLRPEVGIAENLVATHFGPAGERGQYQGFETMYDKNAEDFEKKKQLALSVVERMGLFPEPFLVRDLIDHGYQANRLTDYAVELAGVGSISRSQASDVRQVMKKFQRRYEMSIGKLYKWKQSSNPPTQEEFDRYKKALDDAFQAQKKAVQDKLTAAAQKGGTP